MQWQWDWLFGVLVVMVFFLGRILERRIIPSLQEIINLLKEISSKLGSNSN